MRHHFYDNSMPVKGKLIGVGIMAAAAGAAITYFLYGTEAGEKKRQQISRMTDKIKSKISDTAGDLEKTVAEMNEEINSYLKKKTNMIKNLDKAEIQALSDRIRGHWEDVRDDIQETLEKAEEES